MKRRSAKSVWLPWWVTKKGRFIWGGTDNKLTLNAVRERNDRKSAQDWADNAAFEMLYWGVYEIPADVVAAVLGE